MKKQKPIKLKTEIPPILILGIVSKTGGHRISWLINSILDISLSLSHEKEDNDEFSPYSVYFSQTSENYYKLLSNKNPEAILFKKYKNINYLFFGIGKNIIFNELKEKLKAENDIIAVFELNPNDFTQKFLNQFIL